jgi:hypothetical protein
MRLSVLVLPLLSISVVGLSLGVLGCGKSSESTGADGAWAPGDRVSIALVDLSGCKEQPTGIPLASASSSEDCVEWWQVGGSVLHLRHVNAGFNCCPVVDANVSVEGWTITVEEIELEGNCFCLCLFDVEYEVENVPPGVYQLVFVEPYRPVGDPVLECELDLLSSPSGRYCVDRSQYPWGP